MKDTEIIEKVRSVYDVKEPDVLSRLSFDGVDMVKAEPPKLGRRYVSAVAIYVAACLVLAAVIPIIVGKVTTKNPVVPAATAPVASETAEDEPPITDEELEINIKEFVPEEYYPVLRRYRSAVEAIVRDKIQLKDGKKYSPYTPEHELTEGMLEASLAMAEPDAEKYGYIMRDLDWDGVYELLLITENHVLLEVYGIVDGEVQLIEAFDTDYTGVVMSSKGMFIRNNAGEDTESYTYYSYDGKGGLVAEMEYGTYKKDGVKHFYKAEKGKEREDITEKKYNATVESYIDIPSFGNEEDDLSYKHLYNPIVPTLKSKILEAVERAAEQGRIEKSDYPYKTVSILLKDEDSGYCICSCNYNTGSGWMRFVYCDGEVYEIPTAVHRYSANDDRPWDVVTFCDPDKNGKKDIFILGTWGSGVAGYNMYYFDANTKEFTKLYETTFRFAYVLKETDPDGETVYNLYTSRMNIFVGSIVFEDGVPTLELIREGELNDIIYELEREYR